MPKSDNREALEGLFKRLCGDFGDDSGQQIIKVIVQECGGLRVTIPSLKDLYVDQRNRRIRQLFNGINHKELAICFQMSESQVRRVLNERD